MVRNQSFCKEPKLKDDTKKFIKELKTNTSKDKHIKNKYYTKLLDILTPCQQYDDNPRCNNMISHIEQDIRVKNNEVDMFELINTNTSN